MADVGCRSCMTLLLTPRLALHLRRILRTLSYHSQLWHAFALNPVLELELVLELTRMLQLKLLVVELTRRALVVRNALMLISISANRKMSLRLVPLQTVLHSTLLQHLVQRKP